ncbi:Double-stranded RNA-binding protein 1 [Carex littledalei]|uniref:Double-stranded RNA-binding protein 1 n=1 Tax=Carex littledalei TaxID=544730 RepID=A0A833QZA8_9POAL|nr:Double-stranded RNA-binding protein 1 [Carex littledalei]
MDKQFESPYKKQMLTGPNTSDQIPSGNNISASEDSGKLALLTVEALNLCDCDASMPPGMGSGLHQDRIQVLPRQHPIMVLPPNAALLPFTDNKWAAVSLPRP